MENKDSYSSLCHGWAHRGRNLRPPPVSAPVQTSVVEPAGWEWGCSKEGGAIPALHHELEEGAGAFLPEMLSLCTGVFLISSLGLLSLGKRSLGLLSICYLLINYMMSFDLHIYLYAHFTDRVQGASRKLSHLSEEAQPVSSQTIQPCPLYSASAQPLVLVGTRPCWGSNPDYPIFKASILAMETLRCQLELEVVLKRIFNFPSCSGNFTTWIDSVPLPTRMPPGWGPRLVSRIDGSVLAEESCVYV